MFRTFAPDTTEHLNLSSALPITLPKSVSFSSIPYLINVGLYDL